MSQRHSLERFDDNPLESLEIGSLVEQAPMANWFEPVTISPFTAQCWSFAGGR
jgi:hypothetical protein